MKAKGLFFVIFLLLNTFVSLAQTAKEEVSVASLKGVFCAPIGSKTGRAGIRIKIPAYTPGVVNFRVDWGNRVKNYPVNYPKSNEDASHELENDFDLTDCMLKREYIVRILVSYDPASGKDDWPIITSLYFSNPPTAKITVNPSVPCLNQKVTFSLDLCPREGIKSRMVYGNGQEESRPNHDYSTIYTEAKLYTATLFLENPCTTTPVAISIPVNVIDQPIAALADSGSRAISKDTALVCLSNTNGKAIVRLDASASKGGIYYFTLPNRVRWMGGTPSNQNAKPFIEFSSPGIYVIELETENGCKVRSKKVVKIYKVSAAPTLTLPDFPNLCQRTLFKIPNPVAGVTYFLNDSLEITAAGVWVDYSNKPYKITARTKNECTGNVPVTLERQFYVQALEKVSIVLPRDTTLCLGNSPLPLKANTTNGSWFINGQRWTSSNFVPQQKGTFWIKFQQGSASCISADSVKISVVGTEVKVIDQTICDQATFVVLKADRAGGVFSCDGCQIKGDTLYLAGLNASQINVNYTVTGEYGCIGNATGKVTIGRPRINRLTIKGSCVEQSPEVEVEITGTNQVRWLVNGVEVSNELRPKLTLPAGTSTVTLVAGSKDCFVSKSVQVVVVSPIPIFKIQASTTRGCGPLTVSLTTNQPFRSDVSYRWEKNGEVIGTAYQLAPQRLINDSPKNLRIVFRLFMNQKDGCGNPQTDSVVVTVLAKPQVIIGIDSTNTKYCSPAQVLVTDLSSIKADIRYLYVNGERMTFDSNEKWLTLSAKGDSITIFEIRLVGINECDSTSDLLKVKVYPNRLRMALAMSATRICVGELISFQNTTPSGSEARVLFEFSDGERFSAQRFSRTFTKAGTYSVRMIITLGCVTDTLPRTIVVVNPPQAKVELLSSMVCPNQEVRLRYTGTAAFVYIPEGLPQDSIRANPTFRFAGSGVKTIRFRVFGENRGCFADTVLRVTVRPAPKAIGLNVPDAICPKTTLTLALDMERTALEYHWKISSPQQPTVQLKGQNPTINFEQSGLYDVSVWFTDGVCFDSLSLWNAVRVANCQIGFPDVITPNGDGIGDSWIPFGGEGIQKISYRILDLNGITIYFDNDVLPNDLTRGWRGTNREGKPVGDGTYIYQCSVFVIGAEEPEIKQGKIRLIRDKN